MSVPDFEKSLKLVPRLEALGYEFRPNEEIPDRHYFRRGHGTSRTHHLSLAEPTSRHYRITLAFRDVLRTDSAAAKSYGDLKRDLANRFPRDREGYLAGKAAFVADLLAKAADEPARAS